MILVVGATGSLGGRITRGLLQQGQAVRILTRQNPVSEELVKQGRANTAQSLIEAGAQAVPGDLKDRTSLDAAVKGVDTVITTATASQRGGDDTLTSVDLQGTLALIEAAKAAGVRRFVYTSASGAVEGHPVPLFNIKGTCAAALERSGMEYVILTPSVFMEIWIGMVVGIPLMAKQPVTLIGQGDHRHNLISEADVAAFALAVLNNSQVINQRIDIGGPASYTWTEIVTAVGQALGAPLPVQYLPLGSQVPLMPDEVSGLLNAMETFESFMDMSQTAPAFGVKLTTLNEYIQRTFVH
ncbi:MAG: SDR family oxidoreductase [Chloroflexi bacterium]|nr:SDR family oxidoreductase [Chloroflexota bacterium]